MLLDESKCPVFNHMDIDRCCGCEACAQICPANVLKMSGDSDGFLYPVLIEERCVGCNKCVNICPIYNTKPRNNDSEKYYGVSHRDSSVLLESASGGVFTYIYEEFKKRYPTGYVAGVVYGAGFKSTEHIISNKTEAFQRMRSSKYFQSIKNNIYSATKAKLMSGEAVLFTGTPCEVAALEKYLGKKYETLWTIDFICKGTSTPRMLSDYVSYLEKKKNASVTYMNMRYKWEKLDNWIPQFLRIDFSNGKKFFKEFYNTELGICFQILQRKSCPCCPYREKRHLADFTIGDLHGVNKSNPVYNKLGTSVVILNSLKSKTLWDSFDKKKLRFLEMTKESVYGRNRNNVDSRIELLRENLRNSEGINAVRNSIGIKEKIKMIMPVMLLRRITTWRREHKK